MGPTCLLDSGIIIDVLNDKRGRPGIIRQLLEQGAELAYLLLHDPEFRARVRREHLFEVGKNIRLKANIGLLYEILDHGIEGYHFDFAIISAAPVEVIQSALEGIVPPDKIHGVQI